MPSQTLDHVMMNDQLNPYCRESVNAWQSQNYSRSYHPIITSSHAFIPPWIYLCSLTLTLSLVKIPSVLECFYIADTTDTQVLGYFWDIPSILKRLLNSMIYNVSPCLTEYLLLFSSSVQTSGIISLALIPLSSLLSFWEHKILILNYIFRLRHCFEGDLT